MYKTNKKSIKLHPFKFILIGILLISGCQADYVIDEAVVEQIMAAQMDFSISEEIAKKTAIGFFSTDSSVLSARTVPNAVKIREIKKVKLDETKSYEVFLVNDQEGFMILSGDSRIMPVLAFSPHGTISEEDLYEVNGLKLWYANTMEQIEEELKEVESVHPIVYGEWKKYTEDFDPSGRIWDISTDIAYNTNCYEWYQYGQHMCNPYFTSQQNGPLFSNNISWGQSGVSNHLVNSSPIIGCQDYCGRSPIGCGPVAIAQTIWHYRRNQSFYSSMPELSNSCNLTNQGQLNLANLMLGVAISASTDFYFAGTCNGMTLPSKIRPALTSMGMQNSGSISNFNHGLLRDELMLGYPAIFYGHDNIFTEWHIWTSDGYRRHNYKTYNCDTDGCVEWHYIWFHMNWGWDGGANAWYGMGVFQPNGSSANYNNNLRMITGIR